MDIKEQIAKFLYEHTEVPIRIRDWDTVVKKDYPELYKLNMAKAQKILEHPDIKKALELLELNRQGKILSVEETNRVFSLMNVAKSALEIGSPQMIKATIESLSKFIVDHKKVFEE
jgi:ribosomal protein L30/L7E